MSSIAGIIIQLGQIAILARFLTPEDFGLMALAVVAINFAQAFSDIGLSQAIIHHETISQKQLSTLYWLNCFAGVVVALLLVGVSPFIALAYQEAELEPLMMLTSVCFVFMAGGQQFKVLLQKNMHFKAMSVIEIASKSCGFIVSVLMAVKGFGVYALVFAAIATSFVAMCGYIVAGWRIHRPHMVFELNCVKKILHFGLYTSAERIVNLLSYNLDAVLIGKLLGLDALGIYSLAKQLIMRPAQVINPIITRVTMPLMAKLQNDLVQLRTIYLRTTNYLASVNFAVYGFIAVFAPFIVSVLFGDKWGAAVPIVQILCLYGALRSTGNPIGSLIVAKGAYKLGFFWNLFMLLLLGPVICGGAYFGLAGVCWALVGLGVLMSGPNWFFLVYKLSGAKFVEYHANLIIPLFVSVAACAVAYGIGGIFTDEWQGVFVGGFCGGLVLLVMHFLFNRKFVFAMMSLSGLRKE